MMWKEEILSSPKIKEVKFLTEMSLSDLEKPINNALKEGWEIYGSLIERVVGFSIMMVKYEELKS